MAKTQSDVPKCSECHKAFAKDQTQWDAHVGGGVYVLMCSDCYDKWSRRGPLSRQKK
jgi:hypothetical protein